MGSSDDSPQTCSPQHEVAAPLNRCGDGRVPEVFTASVLRDLDAELVCQGCQQQSGQLLCAQCGAKAYCGERACMHGLQQQQDDCWRPSQRDGRRAVRFRPTHPKSS